MPLVKIFHKLQDRPEWSRLVEIGNKVKQIVAEELSCEEAGGSLSPEHVRIEMKASGRGDYDLLHGDRDVIFMIDANYFTSRKKSLQKRNDAIARRIRDILEFKRLKFSVWTRLFPAAFTKS